MVQEKQSVSLVEVLLEHLPSHSTTFIGNAFAYFFLIEQEHRKLNPTAHLLEKFVFFLSLFFEQSYTLPAYPLPFHERILKSIMMRYQEK